MNDKALPSISLPDEDAKLVTLARGARGRIGAAEGAAIRDDMGRTYSGASVVLSSLQLTAMELAVAQAVAAGAQGIECGVILGTEVSLGDRDRDRDLGVIRDLGGAGVPVIMCSAAGSILGRTNT